MVNFILITVIVLIIGSVCLYIRKEKKKGAVCVGCPHASTCGGNCSGGCASVQ